MQPYFLSTALRKEQRSFFDSLHWLTRLALTNPNMNTELRWLFMPFEGFNNRLCNVGTTRGVYYINDSGALTINATWYSLEYISSPIILIIGGHERYNDYSELKNVVQEKVKAVLVIGKEEAVRKKIVTAFKSLIPVIEESITIEQAVKDSYNISKPGDSVLFSPCCVAEDGLNSHQRAELFNQCVHNL